MADAEAQDSLYVTLGDNDDVLELVLSNAEGMSIRENGEWHLLDPNDDTPTVWDREIVDVNPNMVNFYDERRDIDKPITRDDLSNYTVE